MPLPELGPWLHIPQLHRESDVGLSSLNMTPRIVRETRKVTQAPLNQDRYCGRVLGGGWGGVLHVSLRVKDPRM